MELSAMTFNIRQGRGIDGGRGIDLGPIVDVLRTEAADVVGLQEVHGRGWERGSFAQASVLAASAGYPHVRYAHAATRTGRSHGNALLSRFPIVWSRSIELDPGERRRDGSYVERRVALQALLNVTGEADEVRQVMVIVTHLGHDRTGQAIAIDRLATLVRESAHSTILLGDLNLAPSDPLLEPLLDVLVDSAAAAAITGGTCPAHAPRMRVDYVLASPALVASDVRIVDALASDHLPVVAYFDRA